VSDSRTHPRDRFTLENVGDQAAAIDHALAVGRLHHAWLLAGPQGLGKASFAYRIARRLLGAKPDAAYGPLGAAPEDPVVRLITAQSHPDLLVLERGVDGRKAIPVEEARRLPEFFAKAPALGPYRVAIIDAVDDFNASGANAVLKTLEEPSGRGVLLLVSHAPGRLLPTIRSRCRTLNFRPWPEAMVCALLEAGEVDSQDAARLAAMANGSPGRAQTLVGGDVLKLDEIAQRLVQGQEPHNRAAVTVLIDGLRGGEGMARFTLIIDRLASAAKDKAKSAPSDDAVRWAEVWRRLQALPARVEGLNLDRADALWSAILDIRATAQSQC
jgi:DNA polymerase-3 subunit delta'